MTDQEIRKACAEAMGWRHLGEIGVVDEKCKYGNEYDKKISRKTLVLKWW